jgi:hypothetical protein
MKNAAYSDVTPCGSFKNRPFNGTYYLQDQRGKNQRVRKSFSGNKHAATNIVPVLLIPSTLMIEAMRSSETSVLTRATLRHTPEDGIPIDIIVTVYPECPPR